MMPSDAPNQGVWPMSFPTLRAAGRKLVPEAGLEPARSREQQIFILHYVTIATYVL